MEDPISLLADEFRLDGVHPLYLWMDDEGLLYASRKPFPKRVAKLQARQDRWYEKYKKLEEKAILAMAQPR